MWASSPARRRNSIAPIGGQKGGGAQITELGQEVLSRYLHMEAKASASVQKDLADFTRLMAVR